MKARLKLVLLVISLARGTLTNAAEPLPQSVAELWADFYLRKDPLEVEVLREWKDSSAGRIVALKPDSVLTVKLRHAGGGHPACPDAGPAAT